jgi:hypothetical protein
MKYKQACKDRKMCGVLCQRSTGFQTKLWEEKYYWYIMWTIHCSVLKYIVYEKRTSLTFLAASESVHCSTNVLYMCTFLWTCIPAAITLLFWYTTVATLSKRPLKQHNIQTLTLIRVMKLNLSMKVYKSVCPLESKLICAICFFFHGKR